MDTHGVTSKFYYIMNCDKYWMWLIHLRFYLKHKKKINNYMRARHKGMQNLKAKS